MSSRRLAGLKTVLEDVEETIPVRTLNRTQATNLESLRQGCLKVLEDLEILVKKDMTLSSKSHDVPSWSRRPWERIKWDQKVVQELRSRIVSNTNLLNIFLASLDR